MAVVAEDESKGCAQAAIYIPEKCSSHIDAGSVIGSKNMIEEG
jgi:hypothetical protein